MNDIKIKEISKFVENDVEKTKLVIAEGEKETEIILTGSGKLQVAVMN